MEKVEVRYDNKIVKYFAYATITWGIIGMLVGLIAALQLAFPDFFNDYLGYKYISFGRIRPLHTNAVIFAFVGNAIFTGVYYSLQRLLKTRMWSDKLSYLNFWGWQLIIVSAVITLPMGFTSTKEYAELEWPIDIAITIMWVVFGWNMFATILVRRVKHLYVAIWFYLATFVTVAVLHVFNSFEIPVSFMKSYSWYSGVTDALVQWWYGHNAVAFFLTTPFLGLMYYFVPKAANRPVYSYKLSIIHFWALIFLYIWAGPHHLLYSSLPDWAQSLGVVFSIMLIAPSWGGMLNGLLTLRGVWDKVRDSAVLKFFVVALTAYGMATFEGPMLSLKNINSITHFTDWIVAHVHVGGLGWNGMLIFGMMYYLFPKLYKVKLYSQSLANAHFWIATLGILLWTIPMYWAGFSQGLMWQEFNPDGTLTYPDFLSTVTALEPFYIMRSFGGLIYIIGVLLMAYNIRKTVKSGTFVKEEVVEVTPTIEKKKKEKGEHWHRVIERKPVRLLVFSFIVIAIGGAVEIIPTMAVESNIEKISQVKPYTPLEVEGRDIYIREGCVGCHSQMVRPLRFETERYGEYSKAGEFVYDHPFLWGSKRTGPDLAREGGLRSDSWHYTHMIMPKQISPGSIMPAYPWLAEDDLYTGHLEKKINVLRGLGVPYPEGYEKEALSDLQKQANKIAENVIRDISKENSNVQVSDIAGKEIIALIAYLQRLGTDIKAVPAEETELETSMK
ncbi:cytochrome-c oxidase, cbb3-type subunit I [Brumimicrobium sp.]|uniref:cytochrome-c oxidase, cbb3-type subunit I n=1 Tax=Brumimicrobium sp. TaxID=2029867 RepID=UPI003A8DF544